MKLSLIVQGRHPAGEDMRARLEDDLGLVRRGAARKKSAPASTVMSSTSAMLLPRFW